MVVAPSAIDPNTYFIFREDGCEVKVEIKNNMLTSNKKLTTDESNEMAKRFLRKPQTMSLKEQVLNLKMKKGLSNHHIGLELRIKKEKVDDIMAEYWNKKAI